MGRTNATACYRELGAELKKHRDEAGLTGDDITRDTGWHRSKVCRIELGQAEITAVDVLHYLGACKIFAAHAPDRLLHLCHEAERKLGFWVARHAHWLEETGTSLTYHQTTAAHTISYEPLLIPALLQTPDYTRTLLTDAPTPQELKSSDQVDALVHHRLDRQQILHRPKPARFTFFVHEQALRLQVGSRAVMHEQLLHLVAVAGLPHVRIRIVPSSAGERTVFGGPFRLFEFADHCPLVFLDGATVGLFLEDPEFVREHVELVSALQARALTPQDSRSLAAELAERPDQGKPPGRGPIYELGEEQR